MSTKRNGMFYTLEQQRRKEHGCQPFKRREYELQRTRKQVYSLYTMSYYRIVFILILGFVVTKKMKQTAAALNCDSVPQRNVHTLMRKSGETMNIAVYKLLLFAYQLHNNAVLNNRSTINFANRLWQEN